MRSGSLRFQIILERRVDEQLGSGQVKHTYTEFARVFASVEALQGREYFAAAQIQSDVSTKIRIRYRDDVDETCRARHIVSYASPMKEDIYDITSVLPDAKTGRRDIVLMCSKRRADGWRIGEKTAITDHRVDTPNLRVDDPDWRVDQP